MPDDVSAPEAREEDELRRALIESEKRLQDLIDATSAIVYVKDLDGRYLLVNRRYEDVLGVREADIVGRTLEEVFAPERAARFRLESAAVLREDGPVRNRWFGDNQCRGDRHTALHKHSDRGLGL